MYRANLLYIDYAGESFPLESLGDTREAAVDGVFESLHQHIFHTASSSTTCAAFANEYSCPKTFRKFCRNFKIQKWLKFCTRDQRDKECRGHPNCAGHAFDDAEYNARFCFLVEQDLGLWKHLKPAERSLAVERRGKRPPSLEHCYSDLLLYPPPQIVRADNSLALTDEALQLPKRVLFAQLTVLADNFDVASVCAMLDELKREIM